MDLVGEVDFDMNNPNMPFQQIAVPSGLSACLLLTPLRGQEPFRKLAAISDWGRSSKK